MHMYIIRLIEIIINIRLISIVNPSYTFFLSLIYILGSLGPHPYFVIVTFVKMDTFQLIFFFSIDGELIEE